LSLPKTIPCSYCSTANPAVAANCQSCGALLEHLHVHASPVEVERPVPVRTQLDTDLDIIQMSRKVEQGSRMAMNLYSAFWRALADSAVIAMTAFGLGLTGAVTQNPVWGVILSAALGFFVGLSRKSYLFTLLGAPLGFVGGALIGGVLWAGGLGPGLLVFTTALGASTAAWLGSRWIPFQYRSTWEKFRPLVGAAGGLGFGLLGAAAGSGLHVLISTLEHL
jgi:hypothetical protein